MCSICGCGEGETRINGKAADHNHHKHGHGNSHSHDHHHHSHDHDHSHSHSHSHDHGHDHHHYGAGAAGASVSGMSQGRLIEIETDILAKNNAYAAANRSFFADHGILALNLVSSPGSGKTTLLVETIERLKSLKNETKCAVIEGDQQTEADAERIRATGVKAVQINTGKGCHLDGHMVGHAVEDIAPETGSVLFIENVGNLVCPAAFDLGEAAKVAILSVTEGEDKPLKYPDMFAAAGLVILNKIDLLPHLDFDVEAAVANARKVNPGVKILQLSAKSGEGIKDWLSWINAALTMQMIGHEVSAKSDSKKKDELAKSA